MGKQTDGALIPVDKPKLPVVPTGLINQSFNLISKSFLGITQNFLWFGSTGAIHKGLDLLIDVFNRLPHLNLFIAGLSESDRRLMPKFNRKDGNIFDLGFIQVQSDAFIKLMEQCTYIILPSCSEGVSTSAITCMNHGLIPVLTPACGIDLSGLGFVIEDVHIENLQLQVAQLAQRSPAENEALSRRVTCYSRERFSLSQYFFSMSENLDALLKG
jgi:glycosyltransferase involved in cell wall biosynthesis